MAIDLAEEDPCNSALPSWPRGHKATIDNLKRDASTLAFSGTLKPMMADKEKDVVKRKKKRRRDKEATCATFIDLTKQAMQVQKNEADANLLAEESQIMLVDLSLMGAGTKAWLEKKRTIIFQHDVWSFSRIFLLRMKLLLFNTIRY
jgi:hypothetical protein